MITDLIRKMIDELGASINTKTMTITDVTKYKLAREEGAMINPGKEYKEILDYFGYFGNIPPAIEYRLKSNIKE